MTDERTPTVETPVAVRDEAQPPWYPLLFSVRRSVRYHNRRRSFFDNMHRWNTATLFLAGSAAMVTILTKLTTTHPSIPFIVSALVAIASMLELVIDPTIKARLHADLARRFLELERGMTAIEIPAMDDVREYTAKRLLIEADEPPPLRILDVLCHNELMLAMGHGQDELCYVPRYMRVQADLRSMSAEGLETVGARKARLSQIRTK